MNDSIFIWYIIPLSYSYFQWRFYINCVNLDLKENQGNTELIIFFKYNIHLIECFFYQKLTINYHFMNTFTCLALDPLTLIYYLLIKELINYSRLYNQLEDLLQKQKESSCWHLDQAYTYICPFGCISFQLKPRIHSLIYQLKPRQLYQWPRFLLKIRSTHLQVSKYWHKMTIHLKFGIVNQQLKKHLESLIYYGFKDYRTCFIIFLGFSSIIYNGWQIIFWWENQNMHLLLASVDYIIALLIF